VEELEEDRFIILQVNGRVRGKFANPEISEQPTEKEMIEFAIKHSPNFVTEENVEKAIMIKGKLISIATKREE